MDSKVKTVILVFLYKRMIGLELVEHLLTNSDNYIHIYHDGKKGSSLDLKWSKVREKLEKFQSSERVKLFLEEENIGTDKIIPKGITNAFEEYSEAIILEDDLIVSSDFIYWITLLLKMHKKNFEIGHIAGRREINPTNPPALDLISYVPVWGWATWSDSWRNFNRFSNLKSSQKAEIIFKFARSRASIREKLYWTFRGVEYLNFQDKQNWDCTWTYALFAAGQKSIISDFNRVQYLGLDDEAQHTKMQSNSFEKRMIDVNSNYYLNENIIFNVRTRSNYEKRFAQQMFGLSYKTLIYKIRTFFEFFIKIIGYYLSRLRIPNKPDHGD